MRRGLVAVLGVAAVLVVAVAAMIVMSRRPAGAPAHAGAKRLAVLPFENLGSKEDDYFVDGITDEVRGKLTNLPGLEVIARTSSNGYRKTQKKPQEIGKELDAEYLLTGAVRFAKGSDGTRRVQVSPELSLASSGASRWAQPFDATLTDVFQVQGGDRHARGTGARRRAVGRRETQLGGEVDPEPAGLRGLSAR